jgi:hypothetical protein
VATALAGRTTTSLTTSWSHAIAHALSLSPGSRVVEYAVRATFFGLNLVFNIAMWSLFTAALTRASSTTRVSVVNVSANFFCTALLGLAIFGESLPPTWWAGAALLAAGNVVIGRRDEGDRPGGTPRSEGRGGGARKGEDEGESEGEGEGEGEGTALLPLSPGDEPPGRSGANVLLDREWGGAESTKDDAVQKEQGVDEPIY